jgi:hypothetical protein
VQQMPIVRGVHDLNYSKASLSQSLRKYMTCEPVTCLPLTGFMCHAQVTADVLITQSGREG